MDSQHIMALAILFIAIIGVLGNILSLLMFTHPRMRKVSVNVLLSALSAVDLALLVFSVPVFVIPGLEPWDAAPMFQLEYYAYMLKFVYPTNLIMQTCSIYIVVLITLERWIAVCRPLQVMVWCTPKNSKIALTVVFIGSLLYNSVRYFEYSIIVSPEGTKTHMRNLRDPEKHPGYMVGYFTVSYLITHFVIPFSIMIYMNGSVCWTMISQRDFRATLTRQQQREKSTTILLLLLTILFAVCNTLTFLLNLIECALPDFFTNPKTMRLSYQLNDTANLLVILHSATTFIIYYTFSANYRKTLLIITKNLNSNNMANPPAIHHTWRFKVNCSARNLLRIPHAEDDVKTSQRRLAHRQSTMSSAVISRRCRQTRLASSCSFKNDQNFYDFDGNSPIPIKQNDIGYPRRHQRTRTDSNQASAPDWHNTSNRASYLITWKPDFAIVSVQQTV